MSPCQPLQPSLWYATAPPAPRSDVLRDFVESDVAIVGAGYTGLSTALHLGRRGTSCVILEAEEVGYGGSGRNAGHCTPTFHRRDLASVQRVLGQPWADRIIRKQADSAGLVFSLIRDYAIECEAVQSGYVQAAHAPAMMRKLERKCSDYRSIGKDCRLLSESEVRELTGSKRFFGGWFHPEGGHLNPLAYARGLAKAAIEEGATLYIRSPVTGIVRRGQRWLVQTASGGVLADKVVVATGAYTNDFWPGLQKTYSVSTVAGLASEPVNREARELILPRNTTLVDSRGGDPVVYKYDGAGRLVTSVFVTGRRGGDPAYTRQLIDERTRFLYPALGELEWPHYWYGDLDMHPRTFPRLLRLAPGIVTSIGYSGHGVPTGTMMGTVLADWATGTSPADLALPLEPMRRTPLFTGSGVRIALAYYRWRDRWMANRPRIQ